MTNQLLSLVQQELKLKKRQLAYIQKKRIPPVNGKLRIIKDRNYEKYYLITKKGDRCGTYLKKEDISIAKDIAQSDYNKSVEELLLKQIAAIEKLQKVLAQNSIQSIYNHYSPSKKKLITPLEQPDEIFIKDWLSKQSDVKNSYPIKKEFHTERGEIVRSKSEKMIADKLFLLGIPYKYEQPVYLGNEIRYPDFTILNVNTRKEVYFEHFGSMDDPDYCNSRLETIEKYQLNGLQLGVNFFCTFETLDKPINMQVFENMLYSINLVPNKKELQLPL